jgi:hypothetical protein
MRLAEKRRHCCRRILARSRRQTRRPFAVSMRASSRSSRVSRGSVGGCVASETGASLRGSWAALGSRFTWSEARWDHRAHFGSRPSSARDPGNRPRRHVRGETFGPAAYARVSPRSWAARSNPLRFATSRQPDLVGPLCVQCEDVTSFFTIPSAPP